MTKWLIFTDLDGTLLDHDDYSFSEAKPALAKIRQLRIPLIINSSKTYAEIDNIREKLHQDGAFIVENGAAIFFPAGLFPKYDEPINKVILGCPLSDILAVIHPLRERFGFSFKGFSDFSVEDVMAETALPRLQAEQAKQRLASEPLKWLDSEENLAHFSQLLKSYGLQVVKGGRFYHVMGSNDKAEAMAWLLNEYQKRQSEKVLTIALGDSRNDQKMLEQVDYAGVIRKASGTYMTLSESQQNVIYSQRPAPSGWREVIEKLFTQLNIGEGDE